MSRTSVLLITTALGLGITTAQAHPKLQTSSPARDAKLDTAPKENRMTFSEGLIANFTGLELKNAAGKPVPTGKAMLAPGDNRELRVPIGARLAPGTYTVAWHAVSTDTHRVSGTYGFKVTK